MSENISLPRFCRNSDIQGMISLWNICFGDEITDIEVYFKTAFSPENAAVICDGETIVSMILMPKGTVLCGKKTYKSAYCFAVCTHPLYRNRGFMTKLFSFIKSELRKKNTDILFLVPETESLFGLYEKNGFTENIFINKSDIDFCSVNKKNFTEAELTYELYKKLKTNDDGFCPSVLWNEKEFSYFLNSPFTNTLCINDGKIFSYCVYEKNGDTLKISEICGNINDILSHLKYKYPNIKKATVHGAFFPEKKEKFGMAAVLNKSIDLFPFYIGSPF